MSKIPVYNAYKWICPSCGNHNYNDPKPTELTREDALDILKEFIMDQDSPEELLDDLEEGTSKITLWQIPDAERCQECNTLFHLENNPHEA